MTADPQSLLAACRTALDVRESLAMAATERIPGGWWWAGDFREQMVSTHGYQIAAVIAAMSPDRVLAEITAWRQTLDGWADVLRRHVRIDGGILADACDWCIANWPCPDRLRALAGLSSMARALGVEAEQ